MTVIIGIDPHKASHTATAICPDLAEAATIRVRAARSTPQELLSWAARWPERRWAIEGARGLGQLLAQQLVAAGEHVVDVPATLSARVRTLDTGQGRKTDRIDAAAVALVATQRPDLPRVTADDHHCVLRLLSDRRDELTRQRRRTINRGHRHLRDLIAGGAPTQLSAKTAAGLLAKVRPGDGVEAERKQMARDLLVDVRRLDGALAENRRRCVAAVAASGTSLCDLAGISDVLAAKTSGPHRRHRPVPQRRPPRQLRGYRAHRSQQRRRHPSPAVPTRQPPTQQRDPPRRPRPDHPPRPRTRLLPTPTRRRQQPATKPSELLKRQLTKTIYRTLTRRRRPRPPQRRDLT